MEFPVFSRGEPNLRPTASLFASLLPGHVEEAIRGNPMDAVAPTAGCDRTTLSLLMGAASCDVLTIVIFGGPMLNERHKDRILGSGTEVGKLSEDMRAGKVYEQEFVEAESGVGRSARHCTTMRTASTMACMGEALGIAVPTNADWQRNTARGQIGSPRRLFRLGLFLTNHRKLGLLPDQPAQA